MLRRNRAYRALRVLVVAVRTVVTYRWLELRERSARLRATPAAWARAHERTAARLAALADDLGGLFVKLCQVVGARADVLPEPFVRKLGRFHDRVTPRRFDELRRAVERELGCPLGDVFAVVRPEALAAASLAQVHRGHLRSGEDVVLKIQYPEAERLVTADLASLRLVTGLVVRAFGWVVFRDLVDEVAQFIRLELDFAREAASTERIGGRFAGSACVRVPHVHRGLSTRKLLVLEYLDGIQITDVDRLRAAGLDLAAIAERVATMYVTMIFEHGFFHGDPHPGNLLVLGDGSIGLLDFGLAKELPPGFAAGVADLLVKGVAGDARGAAAAARAIGFEIDDRSADAMAALVRILMGARHDVSALRDALGASPIARAPSHFALVIRTLILLNGLSERLAPGQQLIARAVLRALVPLSQVLVPAPRTGQMRAAI